MIMKVLVRDVYHEINRLAPFESQEKWDNSGFLAGDFQQEISGVLVSLDISVNAVKKASEMNCNLIVSHHPVIFSGLKNLYSDTVVYQLAKQNISAICCHTPLDIAPGGINDLIVQKLKSVKNFSEKILSIEPDDFGRIITLKFPVALTEFAENAKQALRCEVVRYSAGYQGLVHRIAICSGSGASMLEELSGKCDCFLTGDIKHDRWYKAQELNIALLDCGHYHTEVIVIPYVAEMLRQAFPNLNIVEFEEGNPVCYA